jgi:hypothetical protein
MTQVGHTGPLRTSETGRPIPYLDDVALDFPDLVVVGGHIGYPWTNEMIALATKYPNVYIDTSAYAAHRYPAELVEYLRGHGRGKVLFGTNYPMITPGKALHGLDQLGLDDNSRDLFLHASQLYAVRQDERGVAVVNSDEGVDGWDVGALAAAAVDGNGGLSTFEPTIDFDELLCLAGASEDDVR